jgi:hypothetical protein
MISSAGPDVIPGYLGNSPKYLTKCFSVTPKEAMNPTGNELKRPTVRPRNRPKVRPVRAQQKLVAAHPIAYRKPRPTIRSTSVKSVAGPMFTSPHYVEFALRRWRQLPAFPDPAVPASMGLRLAGVGFRAAEAKSEPHEFVGWLRLITVIRSRYRSARCC